jgi:hypothetical protein
MILTTSRRPHAKSRRLCKELESVIPLSQYILRGKKGMRELISLSVEKGADRLVIATSQENTGSLLFYSGWNLLGELSVSVLLRRELDLPKIQPVYEDLPFLLQSCEKDADRIAHLFGADLYTGTEATTYMTYETRWIDFYRLDISENFVGPRLNLLSL